MNVLYIHDRRESGPKYSGWYIFNSISKEMRRRGHWISEYSIDFKLTNEVNEHWNDVSWNSAEVLYTVFKGSYGPLMAAKIKNIPSFLEINYACPETVNSFLLKEVRRLGLSEEELVYEMRGFGKGYYCLPSYVVGCGNKSYTEQSYYRYGINNAKYFSYGIDYDFYKPSNKIVAGKKIKFVFTAAGFAFRKGSYYLFKCWPKIPPNYQSRIELHLVGHQPFAKGTTEVWEALNKGCNNVFNHGFIYNQSEKYLKIHRDADVMICPTLAEGQAATVLEGLSFGLYPIISPYTGTDFEKSPGVWMLSSDPVKWEREIVEGVKFVVDNYAEIRKLQPKIRQWTCDNFKWSRFSKEVVDFIEQVYESRD